MAKHMTPRPSWQTETGAGVSQMDQALLLLGQRQKKKPTDFTISTVYRTCLSLEVDDVGRRFEHALDLMATAKKITDLQVEYVPGCPAAYSQVRIEGSNRKAVETFTKQVIHRIIELKGKIIT